MQWSHFVPAYDRWFDNVYVKRWGQANDTEVKVDHVNLAELPIAGSRRKSPLRAATTSSSSSRRRRRTRTRSSL